jgi:hypothetical protein
MHTPVAVSGRFSVMWGSYLARGVDPIPKPIQCKAAVAWEPNKPLSIEV